MTSRALAPLFAEGSPTLTETPRRDFAVVVIGIWLILAAGPLLGTLLHEVVGHGLTALAVGGTFTGFTLAIRGPSYAYAFAPAGAPAWKSALISADGIGVEASAGSALLAIEFLVGKRLRGEVRVAVTLLGGVFIAASAAYGLLGLREPQWDSGQVLEQLGGSRAVWSAFFVYGLVGLLVVPPACFRRLVVASADLLPCESRGVRRRLLLYGIGLPVLGVLLKTGLGLFDPAIDPLVTFACYPLLAGALFGLARSPVAARPRHHPSWALVLIPFAVGGGLVLASCLWLGDGVHF